MKRSRFLKVESAHYTNIICENVFSFENNYEFFLHSILLPSAINFAELFISGGFVPNLLSPIRRRNVLNLIACNGEQ